MSESGGGRPSSLPPLFPLKLREIRVKVMGCLGFVTTNLPKGFKLNLFVQNLIFKLSFKMKSLRK